MLLLDIIKQRKSDMKEESYWGYISKVAQFGDFLKIFTPNGLIFVVPKDLTLLRPPGPRDGHWMKFFNFIREDNTSIITHVENRTVDIVPVKEESKSFYLIKRKDSGMLAIPGGFIDEEDGFLNISELKQGSPVLLQAAKRELREECGVVEAKFWPLGAPVKERITSGFKPKELISRTWPWMAIIPNNFEMHPGDDATQAPGEPGLEAGWYSMKNGIPKNMHFAHHADILKRAFSHYLTYLELNAVYENEKRDIRTSVENGPQGA
jgi:8-oxo-dGTP pyrophosphatase MutT (NUDIX family)